MIPPGIGLAIGNYIETKFSLWSFNASIRFTRRDAYLIDRLQSHYRAIGYLFDSLLDDADALVDFLETNHQPIINITIMSHCHIKLKAVVDGIRVSTTYFIRNSGGTLERAGCGKANCIFGC